MNKQCKTCGANVPSEAKFCQACGNSDFFVSEPQPAEMNYNAAPNQPATNVYQYNQQPINKQGQSKGKKTWLIIGIVASVMVVLAIIGMLSQKALQELGSGGNTDNNNGDYSFEFDDLNDEINDVFEETPEEVPYSKGTFDGSVYRNEWANIELTVPEGYIDGNQVNYDSFSNDTTECGLYLLSPQREMYTIAFIDVSSQAFVNENTFLAQLSVGLVNSDIENVKYTMSEGFEDITIAGENYVVSHFKATSYGVEFVQSYYVRKIGDRLCNIILINSTKEENDALVSKITSVN